MRVLIAAHGNSIRALVKKLDNISDEDISRLNIPTGVPLVYELDEDLTPIRHYYLGDRKPSGPRWMLLQIREKQRKNKHHSFFNP